jgi:hypothetical protein
MEMTKKSRRTKDDAAIVFAYATFPDPLEDSPPDKWLFNASCKPEMNL